MTGALRDGHRVFIGRIMAVFAITVSVGALLILLVLDPGRMYRDFALHSILGGVVLAGLGWLMVGAEPRNRAVWLFPWMAVFNGLAVFGNALRVEATHRLGLPPDPVGLPVGDLGLTGSLGAALEYSTWVPSAMPMVTLALLWFPDGQVPSRRWRLVPWLAMAATVWLTLVMGWRARPFGGVIPDADADLGVAADVGFLAIGVSIALSLAALVVRYRRSRGNTRRQFRWIAWATGITAVLWLAANLADVLATGQAPGATFRAVSLVTLPVFFAGYGIAIWRHQLYDIDVVISRTLLYGSLALFIGTIYTGVVFGIGSLIGRQDDRNQALSLAATVVVAFLFHPVRQHLERAANRLVYGRRATPYEVLSDLSARLGRAEATEGLLDRMVARLAEATGADQAGLWRWSDPDYEPVAVWPPGVTIHPSPNAIDDQAVRIERAGQTLGALTVTKRRGEELNPTEKRLINDLAGSAGLVLDKARLDAALAEQAVSLTKSRRRLIDAQDDERQRLEQQLHAGTQQHLVHLQNGLQLEADLPADDGLDPVVEQLRALAAETETTQEEIRALAQGIYPPLLEAEGLTAAVEDLARSQVLPVEVRSDLTSRLALDAELAAYFCISEALTNVVKHANATNVNLDLALNDDGLSFAVTDDGDGFAIEHTNGSSTGIVGIRDRLEAIGGHLEVQSSLGHGTTVTGHVATDGQAAGATPQPNTADTKGV